MREKQRRIKKIALIIIVTIVTLKGDNRKTIIGGHEVFAGASCLGKL